jgi:hypothetical protein
MKRLNVALPYMTCRTIGRSSLGQQRIITRNGLTADDEERDMAEIKEDVFAVLMGHDTGCLDPEDLDTENNEYLWLEQALQELQETALLFGRRE